MLPAPRYFRENPDPRRDSYLYYSLSPPPVYRWNPSCTFACQIKPRFSSYRVRNGSLFRTLANPFTCLQVYSTLFTIVFPLRALHVALYIIRPENNDRTLRSAKRRPYINMPTLLRERVYADLPFSFLSESRAPPKEGVKLRVRI